MSDIQAFLKRNCMTWDHNVRHLQGMTKDVCGKYCCLYALYTDRGNTSQKFVALFDTYGAADRQVKQILATEFRAEMPRGGWGQCCRSCL